MNKVNEMDKLHAYRNCWSHYLLRQLFHLDPLTDDRQITQAYLFCLKMYHLQFSFCTRISAAVLELENPVNKSKWKH